MSLPIVSENGAAECLCDAKLADLTRAVQGLQETVTLLAQHSQYHTDQVTAIVQQVGQFGAAMSSMGPAGMIKMMMGKGGKENG